MITRGCCPENIATRIFNAIKTLWAEAAIGLDQIELVWRANLPFSLATRRPIFASN
jgi:hypothetical protein